MFLGLPEPGLAGARHPPKPGQLLDEPAGQPPPGHLLALARAQPATAAGGHWGLFPVNFLALISLVC